VKKLTISDLKKTAPPVKVIDVEKALYLFLVNSLKHAKCDHPRYCLEREQEEST